MKTRGAAAGLMAVGLGAWLLSFLPYPGFDPWKIDMTRLTALMVAAIGLNWEWARSHSVRLHSVQRRWAMASLAWGVVFAVGGASLFLLLSFCSAAGGVLSTWVERAHVAARSLAESVRPR